MRPSVRPSAVYSDGVPDEAALERANDSYGLSVRHLEPHTRSYAEALAPQADMRIGQHQRRRRGRGQQRGSTMGSMRDSGVGRRHGAEGIRKYTEPQTIAVQRGIALAPQADDA